MPDRTRFAAASDHAHSVDDVSFCDNEMSPTTFPAYRSEDFASTSLEPRRNTDDIQYPPFTTRRYDEYSHNYSTKPSSFGGARFDVSSFQPPFDMDQPPFGIDDDSIDDADDCDDSTINPAVKPDDVITVALELFATHGFNETRLKTIAALSGMSKRMIHYHFTDKQGLYVETLKRAVANIRPRPEMLTFSHKIPVDGMREMVELIFDNFEANPTSVRLLVMESLHNYADIEDSSALMQQAHALLEMEKLLMRGQDSGAFRPGISAVDIYLMIVSQCLLPVTYHAQTKNLYGVDLRSSVNLLGRRKLIVDNVIAFLTSHLKSSTEVSYLSIDASDSPAADAATTTAGIYADTGDDYLARDLYSQE